ncbi:MAG: hypothetical protein ACE5PV_06490, partial [Candidatus Poribacteria bacterium]
MFKINQSSVVRSRSRRSGGLSPANGWRQPIALMAFTVFVIAILTACQFGFTFEDVNNAESTNPQV